MSANEYQPLINRMKEIISVIKEADDAYYKYSNPIMTDFRYDKLLDELKFLEKSTGIVLTNSPTQKVSGDILPELTPV